MLVLTRKVGERILIGDSVEVTVLEVKGKRIRLGVIAPREVAVHRAEVREDIERQKIPYARSSLLLR